MTVDRPQDPQLSVPPPGPWPHGPTPARPPTTLRQTAGARAVVFGFIALVAAAALVRGWMGATTTGGRVVGAVLCGTILVVTLVVWVFMARSPLELQVWDDRLVLLPVGGRQVLEPLTRDGGQVRLARRPAGRTFTWGIHQPATDGWLALDLFDLRAVGAALAERGWVHPEA